MTGLRVRGVVFALALAAAAALAVAAGTFGPGTGTTGAVLTLSGFATTPSKGTKVELFPAVGMDQPGLKTVRAKVRTFDASQIEAEVTKGRAGTYGVRIVPTGKRPTAEVIDGLFVLELPVPASIDPVTGPRGTVVTIDGAFGTRKGAVTIGGKKAKVRSWTGAAIEAVVPQGLRAGEHAVVVANKAGKSTADVRFAATASPGGGGGGGGGGGNGTYFRADISGMGRIDFGKYAFSAAYSTEQRTVIVVGTTAPKKDSIGFTVTIANPDFSRPTPYTVGTDVVLPILTFTFGTMNTSTGAFYTAATTNPGSSLAVTVTDWDGKLLTGTFDGIYVDLGGSGQREITNGAFRIRLYE